MARRLRLAGFRLPGSPTRKTVPYRPATYAELLQSGHGYAATGAISGSN